MLILKWVTKTVRAPYTDGLYVNTDMGIKTVVAPYTDGLYVNTDMGNKTVRAPYTDGLYVNTDMGIETVRVPLAGHCSLGPLLPTAMDYFLERNMCSCLISFFGYRTGGLSLSV